MLLIALMGCEDTATLEEAQEIVPCTDPGAEQFTCHRACTELSKPSESGLCEANDFVPGYESSFTDEFITWRGLHGCCVWHELDPRVGPPVPQMSFAPCSVILHQSQ